jgi:hypothetical protein
VTVIDHNVAAKILKSGRIEPGDALHQLAENLDDIARAVFTARYFTKGRKKGRKNYALKKLGAKARKILFGGLVGFWIDAPGVKELPWATYARSKTYKGPFINFAMAYCGALADYLDAEARNGRAFGWSDDPEKSEKLRDEIRSVAADLRSIEQSSSKAREGLRLLGLGKIKNGKRFTKKPHS